MYKILRHNWSILFFFFCLIALNACQQTNSGCIPVKNTSYALADSDKVKVPFTGNDTFNFISSTGNILHLYGTGKLDSYQTIIINGAAPTGCPKPTISYGYQSRKYYSNDTPFTELDFNVLRVQSPNYYGSNGSWIVNGTESYTTDFNTMLNDSGYTDTVSVRGTIYNCIRIAADTGDASNAIYYNHKLGVLKIVFPYLQTWYKQ